jgi:hypothetical protein
MENEVIPQMHANVCRYHKQKMHKAEDPHDHYQY